MLKINEAAPGAGEHVFALANITQGPDATMFELTSPTYLGLGITFNLQSTPFQLPVGYTVSVHLFKNTFHLQQEIIDLRIDGLVPHSGKVGYFFRLDTLFDKGTLQLTAHTYCYAYYALEYLFSLQSALQTQDVAITANPYRITDFFDDETIILILCNEWCDAIPNFSVDNYLANLFLYGFVPFSKNNPIETVNQLPYIEDKYNAIKAVVRPDGVYVLRLNAANAMLSGETFISHLFGTLIQKKNDPVARFLMLYQVVEIYMSKVFPIEISNKICTQLGVLDSHKLKELLEDMKKQKSLIQSLFNIYARPSNVIETETKAEILGFFVHVNHPDYLDATKHAALTLTDLFYDVRNTLVHQYRLLHAAGVDRVVSLQKIDHINWLTEALMAEVVTEFRT